MSQPIRVLIVEDSESDARLVVRELSRGGFDPQFERVETAEAMTAALTDRQWDLILSDYNMPKFSGMAALELLQRTGLDLPFIVVSGAIGEDLAVAAMKAGAHDYLMKGNIKRLNAAIERELREAEVRLQRRQAGAAASRNAERIRALHEIDLAIMSTLDLGDLLRHLLESISFTLPDMAMTIRLLNPKTGELEAAACHNIDERNWRALRRPELTGLSKIILENRIPLTVADIRTDPRNSAPAFARREGLVSFMGIPLIAKDDPLGLIAFYTREKRFFPDDEIEFFTTIAAQAAIGIHNAQLHAQVRKQIGELEKINRFKDQFLAVISHELRTPLNVLMGYVTLVKDGVLGEINPSQNGALNTALRHSHELLGMIDSVLSVQAIEADAVEVRLEEMRLEELCDDLRGSMTVSNGKVTLLWDYPRDLPPIRSDRQKLRQILRHLLDNAIKFTEEGSVSFTARHLSQADAVEFKVSDTGIGISADKLAEIFEMFRQLDSSETRKYGGIGAGLFIVKKLTDMLGGTASATSEPERGSTFTVTLPVEMTNAQAGAPAGIAGRLERPQSLGTGMAQERLAKSAYER